MVVSSSGSTAALPAGFAPPAGDGDGDGAGDGFAFVDLDEVQVKPSFASGLAAMLDACGLEVRERPSLRNLLQRWKRRE